MTKSTDLSSRQSKSQIRLWIAECGLEATIYLAALIIVVFEIGKPA